MADPAWNVARIHVRYRGDSFPSGGFTGRFLANPPSVGFVTGSDQFRDEWWAVASDRSGMPDPPIERRARWQTDDLDRVDSPESDRDGSPVRAGTASRIVVPDWRRVGR